MSEWQQRIIKEQEELYLKLSRLSRYLSNEPDIDRSDRFLLELQLRTMQTYSGILLRRIELFEKDK